MAKTNNAIMNALIFDPSSGASGDMIMGCLLDLGADQEIVREAVESVGCTIEIVRLEKNHIMATKARVISEKRYSSVEEAESILKGSSLRGKSLENALRAFDILASAESKVHGKAKAEARFHEIGALDALADIAGSIAARQSLSVERVVCRPVHVGGGFVGSAHGLLPIPSPATLEILRSHKIPWKWGPAEEELLTPTGVALLATLVDEFVWDHSVIKAKIVGYGAGKKQLSVPNVLRGIIAEIIAKHDTMSSEIHGKHDDHVVQLETNVDDVTGEVLGHLADLLMDAGALDVSILPAMMKKGRNGSVIRVIVRHEMMKSIAKIIIRETGSLGVRTFPSLHRFVAEREQKMVQLEIQGRVYEARIKVSKMDGELLNIKAEYEDCHRIAGETGHPLRNIMRKVEEEGRRMANDDPCHPQI